MAHDHLASNTGGVRFAPPSAPPFSFAEGAATPPFESALPTGYVLIQSAGPVDPSECEDERLEAVEITVLWGETVLSVEHLTPPRAYSVGHGEGAVVDYVLPRELMAAASAPIVAIENGVARPVAPAGALLSGDDVCFGALTFRVKSVVAGKRLPRALGTDTRGLGGAFVVSLASVAAFMGALAYYTPALGASLDNDLDRDRIEAMRVYLQAQADRERDRKLEDAGKAETPEGGGTPGQAAKGPEGKMGKPNQPSVSKRTAIAGTGELTLSREAAIREAQTFGMIQTLEGMNARMLPTAAWSTQMANGPDATDAWGELYGKEIGESGGFGGLGLSGLNEGGGHRGDWIGMGQIGTCGTNCGVGPGDKGGIGSHIGRGNGPGHVSKGPSVRPAGITSVSGHIPAEVIQRVVRQNFGRFRLCYEGGLRANPNLNGRVAARFVIGRDGSVSNVSNGGSDLADSKVVGCVMSAFYGLSFPSPEQGIVTVTYPIMFTPG